MKKTIITLAILLMVTMCITGCGNKQVAQEQTAPVEQENLIEEETLNEETEEETAMEAVTETHDGSGVLDAQRAPVGIFEVETPYCMITYPLTWRNNLEIEQDDVNGMHIVSFYGAIEGKENVRIFDVIFGGYGDQGDQVGRLEVDGQMIPVCFKTYSVRENESLSFDDIEMLVAMLEDINVIYSGLSVLNNFN